MSGNNKLNLLVQFTGVDKLSQNIRNIVGAAGKGSEAIDDMRRDVRLMEKDLAKVHRTLAKGGSQNGGLIMAERELSEAIARTNHEIDRQQRRLDRVANVRSRAAGMAEGLGKAGAFATASITVPLGLVAGSMDNLAERSRGLRNAASVAGMGFEQFQRDAHAASTLGIEYDKFGDILKDTQDKIGDFTANGGGEMKDFFDNVGKKVGITAKNFKDLSGADALQLYYNSLVKAGVSHKEMVFYMEAIADEGSGLIPILKNNGAALKELGSKAAVISDSDAAGLEQYNQAQTRLETSTTRLGIAFAKSGLIDMMTWLSDKGAAAANWFGSFSPTAQRAAVLLGLVAAVAGPVLIFFGAMASAAAALTPIIATVAGVMGGMTAATAVAAAPLIAIVAAVAGAAYLIYTNWSAISGFFSGVWTSISTAVTSNWTTIRNVLLGALVVFMPLVAAAVYVASLIYRNWDSISNATMSMVSKVAGIVAPFIQPFMTIIAYLAGLGSKFFGFGVDIVGGLINGIVSMTGSVIKAIINLAAGIGGKFASLLGIRSPSRLFMEMGGHINDGLGIGIDKGQGRPVRAVSRMAGAVAGASALALSPGARAVPAAQKGGNEYHFHITQQPGEDSEAFARRTADLLRDDSEGKRRRAFEDDF